MFPRVGTADANERRRRRDVSTAPLFSTWGEGRNRRAPTPGSQGSSRSTTPGSGAFRLRSNKEIIEKYSRGQREEQLRLRTADGRRGSSPSFASGKSKLVEDCTTIWDNWETSDFRRVAHSSGSSRTLGDELRTASSGVRSSRGNSSSLYSRRKSQWSRGKTPTLKEINTKSVLSKVCPMFAAGLPCNNDQCLYLHEHYDVADYFMQAQFNEITILSPVHVNTLQRRARLGSPFSNLARPGSRQSVDSKRLPSRGSEPSTFSPPRTPMSNAVSRPETPHAAKSIQRNWRSHKWHSERKEAATVIQSAYRSRLAYKIILALEQNKRISAACRIQAWSRKLKGVSVFANRIKIRVENKSAVVIQKDARMFLAMRYVTRLRNKREHALKVLKSIKIQRWFRQCRAHAFMEQLRSLKNRREKMTNDILYMPLSKHEARIKEAMANRRSNSVMMSIATFACARLVSLSKYQYYHHGEGLESLAYLQHVFLNGVEDGHGEIYSAKETSNRHVETNESDSGVSANVRAESVLIVSKCCEMEVRQKDQMPQGLNMVPKEYFQHDKTFLVSVGRRIAGQYIEIHAFKRGTYYVFEAYEHHRESSHYRGTVVSHMEEMKEIFANDGDDEQHYGTPEKEFCPNNMTRKAQTSLSKNPVPSQTPAGVIIALLRRGVYDRNKGGRVLSIAELGKNIRELYGLTYGKLYRKKYGPMTKYIQNAEELKNVVELQGQEITLFLRDDEDPPNELSQIPSQAKRHEDDTFFYVSKWRSRPKEAWKQVAIHNATKIDNTALERCLFRFLPIECRIVKMERIVTVDENSCDFAETEIVNCTFNTTHAVLRLVWASKNYRFKCINALGNVQLLGLRIHPDLMKLIGTPLMPYESSSPQRKPRTYAIELCRRAIATAIIVESPAAGENQEQYMEDCDRSEVQLANEWYQRRRTWWKRMTRVHPHARYAWNDQLCEHGRPIRSNSIDTRRVFFIPPIQNRRIIAYEAGLKIQAVFYIMAKFHPIQTKVLGARRRFHIRTSIKHKGKLLPWLRTSRATIKHRHSMATKIEANVRAFVYSKRFEKQKRCSLLFQKIFRGWKGRKRAAYIRELLVGDWPKVEIAFERGVKISNKPLHLRIWKCGLHYLLSAYDHENCTELKGFLPRWRLEQLCKKYPHGVTGSYSLRKRIKIRPNFTEEVLALIIAKLAIVEPIKGLGGMFERGGHYGNGEKVLVIDGDGRGRRAEPEGILGTYLWRESVEETWISEEEQRVLEETKRKEEKIAKRKKEELKRRQLQGRETHAERMERLNRLALEEEMRDWKERKYQWPAGKAAIAEIWEWWRNIVKVFKVLTEKEERGPLRANRIKYLRMVDNAGDVKGKILRLFKEMDPLATGYIPSWEMEMNLYWLGEDIPIYQINNFIEEAVYVEKGSKVMADRKKFMERFSSDIDGPEMIPRLPGSKAGYIDYRDFIDRNYGKKMTLPTKHPYKSMMRNIMLKFKKRMNDRESALRKCEEIIKPKRAGINKKRRNT